MEYTYGIEKVYNIVKRVRRKLILNDKVIDYLYNKLSDKNKRYVLMTGYSEYKEITKDVIKDLLQKAEQDGRYWNKDVFAELADYPEYDGVPFEVTHASPYDHRWPGDYDEDAYDDWKVDACSLSDLLYDDTWNTEPVFAEHPENFDFEDEEVEIEQEKLTDTRYGW